MSPSQRTARSQSRPCTASHTAAAPARCKNLLCDRVEFLHQTPTCMRRTGLALSLLSAVIHEACPAIASRVVQPRQWLTRAHSKSMGPSPTFRWLKSRCHCLIRRLLHIAAYTQPETAQVCHPVRTSLSLVSSSLQALPPCPAKLIPCSFAREGVRRSRSADTLPSIDTVTAVIT